MWSFPIFAKYLTFLLFILWFNTSWRPIEKSLYVGATIQPANPEIYSLIRGDKFHW